jgi:Mn-dependent DtxR family transcriptional regulator
MTVAVTDDSRYAVLKALDGAGRLTVQELAPEAKIARSSVYVVLAECEKDGLVTFDTYQRPRKKRNGKKTGAITTKRYILTPKGRKIILEAEGQ